MLNRRWSWLSGLALAALAVPGISCSGPTSAKDPMEATVVPEGAALATFAGGCFWCMEPPFEKLDGVYAVVSGYSGGPEVDPTYPQVSSGRTGHAEAVQVSYDPEVVDYRRLLDVFWRQIDPTDAGGQFADRGRQYRTAVFYHDEEQRTLAEQTKKDLSEDGPFDAPIVTEVLPAGPFYAAEEYHQDFYKKDPRHYKAYRTGSGREGFLMRIWGNKKNVSNRSTTISDPTPTASFVKPAKDQLRQELTPLQYQVTQEDGTERPFANEHWDNKKEGIYIDIVSGEPLFSSLDKFASGTGWPSFTRPLVSENIVEHQDRSLPMVRTEVRSGSADSHLGHLFDDGPAPTGLRYCINSASLEFVPKDQLESRGYGEFAKLFESGDASK